MTDFDRKQLHCYGCGHSAAGEKFPGKPSGERPCCFCIRNPEAGYEVKVWYDGSEPVRVPMDCYITMDMSEQMNRWFQRFGPADKRAERVMKETAQMIEDVLNEREKQNGKA